MSLFVVALGTAAAFAAFDLIPGLHRGRPDAGSMRQIILIAAGIGTIALFGA